MGFGVLESSQAGGEGSSRRSWQWDHWRRPTTLAVGGGMGLQEKTSLPITRQALEITFLAFSWKLKCRRRGSGRDPSTLRFTGSGVGSCRGSAGGQPGAGVRGGGCSCRDAALGAGWSGRGQKGGWKSKEGCQAGAVGEVGALLAAGMQSASGGCGELRRVRCKLLQPCSPALLSSPTWLCAHACSPKGKCEKAEAVCHPL